MKYVSFKVENFKGIQGLDFPMDTVGSPIATLVGLNESGKTTILEALSTFYGQVLLNDESTEPLLHNIEIEDIHSLIPKGKKANFNGKVLLTAQVQLSEKDKVALVERLSRDDWIATKVGGTISITIEFRFENSKYIGRMNLYGMALKGRGRRKRKERALKDDDRELWSSTMRWLASQIPPIIYYPNFLFEFPEKIYIEEKDNEEKENRFYRMFLQDVLDSLENDLDLKVHVLDRAKSSEPAAKEALELVLNRLSSKISGLVFDPELSVFKVDQRGQRNVVATLPQLDPVEKRHFVSIRLKDGVDSYSIRERSLGFRWFFTFLLLTQFRITRFSGPAPVFLFDEPASNLHQAAQQRLLKALEQLTKKSGVSVIYTTHSHHLIDPRRLESTYIVRNRALDASGLNDDFNANMTNIDITPYRQFVGSHPDQRSYFQPILDVLEYRPSNLENIPNVVMTEGKADYYLLTIFQRVLGIGNDLRFLPGGGAGGLDTPIQLYLAWGRPFVVLLDGDEEGKKQAKRYKSKFGPIVDDKVLTLQSLNRAWASKAIEDLLTPGDRMSIQKTAFPDSKRESKRRLHLAVQELLATGTKPEVSAPTRTNMKMLLERLERALAPESARAAL